MPEYLSPGVYVEEVDRGPKPIEGVGTAMAAFVGFTEKAEYTREVDGQPVVENLINRPQLVTNWTQYRERFGDFVSDAFLPQALFGYFMNGGSRCYVMSVRTFPKASAQLVNKQGKPALLVNAISAGSVGMRLRVRFENPEQPEKGAKKEEKGDADAPEDEGGVEEKGFTLFVDQSLPNNEWRNLETVKGVELQQTMVEDEKQVQLVYPNNKLPRIIQIMLASATATVGQLTPRDQEQPLVIDKNLLSSTTTGEFKGDIQERSGVEGLEALDDVTMLVVPDLMTTMPGEKLDLQMVKAVQTMMIAHCERMGDRVAILDTPPDMTPQEVKNWRMNVTGFDSSYAALYYPWIEVSDPITNKIIAVPPSGHMAGVWARNDNTRGVHKAPANEVVQGAVGTQYHTTKGEQDTLNPNGVNCIRSFPGRGIRVWGARTLTSDPAWRYISVRRLFNYVEKSIENGTQWIVFEPNNRKLWARVRRDITAFMKTVWRDGALFGSSPDEAFYVKCDDELNPPESRDLGRLIIEIGMSPVKPAEFVIFRISQWAGPGSE